MFKSAAAVCITLTNAERKCSMQREQCVKGLTARKREGFRGECDQSREKGCWVQNEVEL